MCGGDQQKLRGGQPQKAGAVVWQLVPTFRNKGSNLSSAKMIGYMGLENKAIL